MLKNMYWDDPKEQALWRTGLESPSSCSRAGSNKYRPVLFFLDLWVNLKFDIYWKIRYIFNIYRQLAIYILFPKKYPSTYISLRGNTQFWTMSRLTDICVLSFRRMNVRELPPRCFWVISCSGHYRVLPHLPHSDQQAEKNKHTSHPNGFTLGETTVIPEHWTFQ